jgi:cytochrome c2
MLLAACGDEPRPVGLQFPADAPPPRVYALLRTHGCVHCHTIGGVPGATGRVGPSLVGFERRAVFAGGQPTREAELILFLLDPRSVSPGSAMPSTVTGEDEAADIAAWLLGQDR